MPTVVSSLSAGAAADCVVIGAGMAGASIAYRLSQAARVIVLEREAQPGYHATGRSAALFVESYGAPQIRALTRASRPFLDAPPAGFAPHPILSRRGALQVATAAQRDLLERHEAIARVTSDRARRLDADAALAPVPVLRREGLDGAIYEPDAADIDVDLLHRGFLRGLRHQGGRLVCNAGASAIDRVAGDWEVDAGGTRYRAPILVNAAGAWCDLVAELAGIRPLGLQPKRRTAFLFKPPEGHDVARWPCFGAIDESFYVKPEAGLLLGSPANADPVPPQDAQPEEIDIAIGIDRIESRTHLEIRRPIRSWAGLRSFVSDGGLVGGYDPSAPGFFWLAAQGGYGIQTAPAMSEAAAALALGRKLPAPIADVGLTAAMLGLERLR